MKIKPLNYHLERLDIQNPLHQMIIKVNEIEDLNEIMSLLKSMEQMNWNIEKHLELNMFIPILDRFDGILNQIVTQPNAEFIGSLPMQANEIVMQILRSTLLFLKHSIYNRHFYASIEHIIRLLDSPDWLIVEQCLNILYELVNRYTSKLQNNLAHQNQQLSHKLFVISQGHEVNNPNPYSIIELLYENLDIQNPQIFEFWHDGIQTYELLLEEAASFDEVIQRCQVPEEQTYQFISRLRITRSLKSPQERTQIIKIQLLAMAVFVQQLPEQSYINKLMKTLPKDKFLQQLAQLFNIPCDPQIHQQAINCLSAFLVMQEGQPLKNQELEALIKATWNILDSQLQHGLLQTLLRDVTRYQNPPALLSQESVQNQNVLESMMHLSQIVIECQFRQGGHISSLTASFLKLVHIPNTDYQFSPVLSAKNLKILSLLIGQNIDIFRELGGMEIIINALTMEIELLTSGQEGPKYEGQQITEKERKNLIKSLFWTLKTATSRSHGQGGHQGTTAGSTRKILEHKLPQITCSIFSQEIEDLYQVVLSFFTSMMNDQPNTIPLFIQNQFIPLIMDKFQNKFPSQPKVISCISKLFQVLQIHQDGIGIIVSKSSIIDKLIGVLGHENYLIGTD